MKEKAKKFKETKSCNEKMNKNSKERGITLIALIVTIIVLLILAGVTIATLTGENGIITKAIEAREKTEIGEVKERVQLDILGEQSKGEGKVITAGTMQEILNKYFSDVPEDAKEIGKETVLTAKEEYGGHEIELSEMYTGEIIAEQEPIEETEEYTASFADMDGDGTADGIIYADLAVGGSGLKKYFIETENYTEPRFGNITGKLIAPIEGTSGEDRFYVMALEDVNPGTSYCWYYAAEGRLDKIVDPGEDDFGDGKENTEYVMKKWELGEEEGGWGAQNDGSYEDMWGAIKGQVEEGWFVPSSDEWSAFTEMAVTKAGLTTSNHSDYGLNGWYWSSLQYDTRSAYAVYFGNGNMYSNSNVALCNYVRLSATF